MRSVHRLDPIDLSIQAERHLPANQSHNGLLALSDGTLITRDLQLEGQGGQGGTTISRFDPEGIAAHDRAAADAAVFEDASRRGPRDTPTTSHSLSYPGTPSLGRS